MNAEELIERLKKSFSAPSKKDEKIKVVLICIVISTTFWFFNALNQDDYTSQISYPVEWIYDQENYIAVGDLPSRVALEVNGGGWDLMTRFFGFNMNPVAIELEEPSASKYVLTSQLRGDLSRSLDPVSVNFLIQDSLNYNIQPKVARKLKLVFNDAELDFDSDYKLNGEYQLTPDSLEVVGPQSLVYQLPNAIEVSAEVSGIDGDRSLEIDAPELPDMISASVENLRLSFEVMRFIPINERKLVELVNLPDTTWVALPSEISIDYKIGESQFDVTDSSRIRIVADYNRMNRQDSSITLEVIQGRDLIQNIQLSSESIKLIKR